MDWIASIPLLLDYECYKLFNAHYIVPRLGSRIAIRHLPSKRDLEWLLVSPLMSVCALKELERRRAKEARKARYKRDRSQRRIASNYEVIKAGDARL